MDFSLDSRFNNKKILVIFSVLSSLLGLGAAFLSQLGFLLAPLLAASLAVVFVLEKGRRRILTIALPLSYIILDLVLSGIYSFNCLLSVLVALAIYLYFSARLISRTECAGICTVLISVFLVLLFILACFYSIGSFDFAELRDVVDSLVADAKAEFLRQIEAIQAAAGADQALIDSEAAIEMFDLSVNLTISFVVVFGFALAGIALKLFRTFVFHLSGKNEKILADRFAPSVIYAYFYMVLSLITIFVEPSDGVIAISIMNLYYVFMFVFAYLGMSYLSVIIRMRSEKRGGLLVALLVIFILLSLSLSIQLLAAFGVLFNIFSNRYTKTHVGGDGEGK